MYAHPGYGAYICGEETALLESLEGKKGQPRFKPPFPASYGLYGKPTTINNTETFAAVPWIVRNGGDAFLALGRPNNGGTKLFSVTGHVNKPGNYEVRLGTPFAKLLEMAGGVRKGHKLKAVIPGGSSMPVLPAEIMMKTDMDYDSIAKAGSMLGSGAVIVMDDSTCMVRALERLSYFYFEESCGQCTPCREGTGWLYRVVHRIENGQGRMEDLELLDQVSDNIAGRTICALGDAAALPVKSFIKHFRDEFVFHIQNKKCLRAARHRAPLGTKRGGVRITTGKGRIVLKVEIDGKEVEVPHGSTVMDATNKLGVYVPHFCYHRKLSIAANCRMCLVEVEKAPKPLPACATPVTDGMKVRTHSPVAKKAQNGVMEFLLINHPLDCPICDQGGECQLQDLAVGYGDSNSRYTEEKRVVFRKELGPLVAAEEMSRCIQCTRCVRFGQEIAGVMELGMIGRGEHAEIVSFVGRAVDSELSGNMIDLCPVGALTSEPFRYSARTWELSRRKSVSPHDGLGSNLVVQVKQNRVMRVLPLENEAVNECWLSDKDRFSYEGLNSPDRLTRPMVKKNGQWEEVDWEQALDVAVRALQGADFGVLASPHSTLEELFLAAKLGPADFRLRHSDFSADGKRAGIPWLGMPIAELQTLDRVLVVGSFLRKDHPLIAHRLRQAAKRGTQIHMLHSVDDDWLMPIKSKKIVAPSRSSGCDFFFRGNSQGRKERRGPPRQLRAAASAGGADPRRGAGAGRQGRLPRRSGELGRRLRRRPADRRSVDIDPAEEGASCCSTSSPSSTAPTRRRRWRRMRRAQCVISLSAYKTGLDYAHVLLPIAPFTETAGSFVSTEGRVQSFHATVNPLGEARPAWKVLRVLGTMLGRPGFELDTVEQVRAACLGGRDIAGLLSNRISLEVEIRSKSLRASSASPTCRSTSPIRWCAARRRCRRRATRGRRRRG